MPKPQDGGRLFPTARWLSIAAAVLVTSGGLVARFTSGSRPAVPSSSPLPLENAEQGPPAKTVADAGIPIRTSDVAAVSTTRAAPATAGARREKNLSPEPRPQHPAVVTLHATATPALGPTSASAPETPRPAVQALTELTFLNVVHVHLVGSCQGRLVVSRDGVAFVPDDKTGKDAFTLKYSEFLQTLADSKLTIKSNSRTYRFKAAAVASKDDKGSQLQDVVESIGRFRQATHTTSQ